MDMGKFTKKNIEKIKKIIIPPKILKIIKFLGYWISQMERNMKVILDSGKNMEEGSFIKKMEIFMKDIGKIM